MNHDMEPLLETDPGTAYPQYSASVETTATPSVSVTRKPKRQRSVAESINQPAKSWRGEDGPSASNVQGAATLGAVFSGVHNVQTYGGVYTAVGGDYVTIHNYHTYQILPQSRSPSSQRRLIGKGKAVQNTCRLLSSARVSSTPLTAEEISFPELFPQIQQSLEFIKQLIEPDPPSEGTCHGISGDLVELDELLKVASLAYHACDSGTLIGRLLRNAIDMRMLQCKTVLMGIHQDLVAILRRSFPPAPLRLIFDVVYRWWTGSEPNDIAATRLALNLEARAVGEWICNLKLFDWAPCVWHSRNSTMSWKAFEELIGFGPKILQEIHVERIVVLEPLQGEALSIPIRFAESFEDVHRIIQFACERTHGNRFIQQKQYQIDESRTNLPVNPARFGSYVKDGKMFEVTMLVRASSLATTDCPRCGLQNDKPVQGDLNWIKCVKCHTFFASQISEPCVKGTTSSIEEVTVDPDDSSKDSNKTHGQPNSKSKEDTDNPEAFMTNNIDPLKLFRRMKIEISVTHSDGVQRSIMGKRRLRVRRSTVVPGGNQWAVPPRVLLVDDDAVGRKISTKFLQEFGCTTDVTIDGVGAVNKMNLERYDLVFMNIVMPKLDGVSATSIIRKFDKATPIIAMTSCTRPEDTMLYFSAGMNDVLPKPFTKRGLLEILQKHLRHLKRWEGDEPSKL